jgi:hypothetical protein
VLVIPTSTEEELSALGTVLDVSLSIGEPVLVESAPTDEPVLVT